MVCAEHRESNVSYKYLVPRCSCLVTAAEARPLMEAASKAAQPPPTDDPVLLGRGRRKRSAQSLAELGERAFKRLLAEGQAPGAGGSEPAGLRKVVLLGAKRAVKGEE